jgi:hypothetical protein
VAYTIQNVDEIPVLERIPEVISRLEEIQKIVTNSFGLRDGLGYFNYLYTVITKSVQADLEKDARHGGFQDKAFLSRLDVEFANRYFRALDAQGTPAGMPPPWNALIANRSQPHIAPLIFAVVGVSAHVNYDLPFALVETCKDHGGLTDGTRHADYQHVNSIFAQEMKGLRYHFERYFARQLDTSYVSTVENLLSNVVVVLSRNFAWNQALEDLWPTHDDPNSQEQLDHRYGSRVGLINGGLLTVGNQLGRTGDVIEWTFKSVGRLAQLVPVPR